MEHIALILEGEGIHKKELSLHAYSEIFSKLNSGLSNYKDPAIENDYVKLEDIEENCVKVVLAISLSALTTFCSHVNEPTKFFEPTKAMINYFHNTYSRAYFCKPENNEIIYECNYIEDNYTILEEYTIMYGRLRKIGGVTKIVAEFDSILDNILIKAEVKEEDAKIMGKDLFKEFALEGSIERKIYHTIDSNAHKKEDIIMKVEDFFVMNQDSISDKIERLHHLTKGHYPGIESFAEHFRNIRDEEDE